MTNEIIQIFITFGYLFAVIATVLTLSLVIRITNEAKRETTRLANIVEKLMGINEPVDIPIHAFDEMLKQVKAKKKRKPYKKRIQKKSISKAKAK